MRSLKLPFIFEEEKLLTDLKNAEGTWIPHHRTDHSTTWHALNLRTIDGDPVNNKYHKDVEAFKYTPIYNKCSYIPEIMEVLECPKKRVRLLKLMPGGLIKRHTDPSETLLHGEVRLHVPVITDPRIQFFIGGQRVVMGPGELWYINTIHRHRVYNPTDITRIHLVIDCVVNDNILNLVKNNSTGFQFLTEKVAYSLRPVLIAKDLSFQKIARTFEKVVNLN